MILFVCPFCPNRFDLSEFLAGGRAKCMKCGNLISIECALDRSAGFPPLGQRTGELLWVPHGAVAPLEECIHCGSRERVAVRQREQTSAPIWALLPAALLPTELGPAFALTAGVALRRSATILLPECDACLRAHARSQSLLALGAILLLPVAMFLFGVLGELVKVFIPRSWNWRDDMFFIGLLTGFIVWAGLLVLAMTRIGRAKSRCIRIDDQGVVLRLARTRLKRESEITQ